MPNIQAISREHHTSRRWQRPPSYAFTTTDALCPLVVQELPKAMLSMPIGFLADEGTFMPVAIQGLKPGKNLFVALNGQWVGGYIPAAYRSYPFLLANAGDGKQVLCVNEDSGLLSDIGGEAFFGEDGQPSKAVAEILSFLDQIAANRMATRRICVALQKHNLIQPWPIKLQGAEGHQAAVQNIEGLFRVDEAALNRLPAEAFIELREAGALVLAYCQLLSMQHLPLLGQLAEAHAKVDAQAITTIPTLGQDLDLSFMSDGDTLNFSWME